MRSKKINLNLMIALNALLNARSITEAASRVALSQPAMSIALRKLRDHYQDEIVTPGRDGLILTELGRQLRPMVSQTMQNLDQVIALETGFDPSVAERRFTIRAPDLIELTLVSDLVRRVAAVAPGVQIICGRFSYGAPVAAEYDVDLVILAERFGAPDLMSDSLHTETFSCIAWNGNSRVGQTLTLEDYKALPHASVASLGRMPMSNPIDDAIAAYGVTPRVQVRASMFSALSQMIIGTDMLATTYTRFAEACARILPLRVFKPPLEISSIPFAMQWAPHRDNDPGLAWLRGQLKLTAAKL